MEFSSVNTIWVLLGAALVFFHAGRLLALRSRLYKSKEHR